LGKKKKEDELTVFAIGQAVEKGRLVLASPEIKGGKKKRRGRFITPQEGGGRRSKHPPKGVFVCPTVPSLKKEKRKKKKAEPSIPDPGLFKREKREE